ncbi:MAG TPA: glycosyltransferase [Chthoniobacterales bacterium]|nr:glycosyltransferase [Chthoniobacterales bacterium]
MDLNRVNGNRPRVLFFSHETTLSGAPMQLLHLLPWLRDRGWAVTMAAPEAGPISDLLAAEGVETVIDGTLLTDPSQTRLREICAEFGVVVANTIVSWPAVRAASQLKVPVIWYLHETLVAIRLMGLIPEIQPTLRMADLLVTPTRRTAEIYQDLTDRPVAVVPYGIPAPPQVTLQEKGRGGTFVTLGSFEPRKGQDVLLEAIGLFNQSHPGEGSFKMAGRVLEPAFFEKLQARASGFQNVELISALDHSEATALLNEADVLVSPSRDETMPIAILEAMGLGKTVVSTNVGGVCEWIYDGMNGLIVPPENPPELAAALTRCATDPKLLAQLGATARRTFDHHFTLERFGTRFAELIESVAQREIGRRSVASISYEDWIARFDTTSPSDRAALRRRVRAIQRQPLISVILPVYDPDLEVLAAAIESVERQLYDRWELCIADDASTDPRVRPFLEEKGRGDARIKVTFREKNGHISACSNSAIELATGEWCALLDQDDAFAESALAFAALEIDRYPEAGLIYSDEDKIDASGVRSNPFFKPDWNPELFLGQNFINHLGVYRTALLRAIGGFREGFEGSQDYDLALRCVENLEPAQVRHIPRILYHWRAVAGSLAAVADAKPYAKAAARRAIGDHLRRQEIAGRVEACPENVESHRVVYAVPEPSPKVSIVIPMRDRVELIERCVASIREGTDYPSFEFVIVDNGSTEPATLEFLRALQEGTGARIVRDDAPFNFSRLINRGAAAAEGAVLAFLNNDIEADEPGWLREMVSHAVRPGAGAVGARLWFPDGTLQHGGVILGLGGVAGHPFARVPRGHAGYFNRTYLQQNCSAVTGACMLVRREVFEEAGGFDEINLGISFNDVDFCLRLRAAGLQNVWTPYANLVHHESASRGHQRTREEQAQFVREAAYMQRKWGFELLHDPLYNPNLSLNLPGFELAVPPRLPEFSTNGQASVAFAKRAASMERSAAG